LIGDVNDVQAGRHIEHVNRYVTDGEIALADLKAARELVRAHTAELT